METALIQLRNVSKQYQGENGIFKAVDDISLSIERNEIFGVIGESGAGKSTLLRFINGLEVPDAGSVHVDGNNIHELNKKDLRLYQKRVGMIFQQFNLLSNKTVEENIRLPLELHRYEDTLPIDQILEFVGLSDKRHHYPSQLSGGQKQRVGIARALIIRPDILLCDEPTSALDQNTTQGIVDLLKRAHEKYGMTVVIVTHELEVIKSLCQRAAILEKGKLLETIQVKQQDQQQTFKTYYQQALEVLTHE